jgi:hypothetical protein
MSYSVRIECTNCNNNWSDKIPNNKTIDDWLKGKKCIICNVENTLMVEPMMGDT